MTIHSKIRRYPARLVAVGALVAAAAIAAAIPVSAASAEAGSGWLRLAHLSPDTKAVDVRVVPLGSSTPVIELNDVAYGTVSPYSNVPSGVYNVTMVKAGEVSTARPVLASSLRVNANRAETVAAYGRNSELKVQSFFDDLTTPQPGNARVRLLQASTKVNAVNVRTTTGVDIAKNTRAGSVTGYAAVAAGQWNLELSGKGVKDAASVNLADGSVSTLLVLDTASGLTIRPVLDSSAVGQAPVGGVNTGGGYLATHEPILGGSDEG